MMMRRMVAAFLVVPVIACRPGSKAPSGRDTAAVEREIAAQFDTLSQIFRTHDWDALEPRFAEGDRAVLTMDGVTTVGRDAILAQIRADSSVASYVDYRFDRTTVRALGPDAAVHSTDFWERLALRSGDTVDLAGTWTNMFERRNGRWQIVHMAGGHRPTTR